MIEIVLIPVFIILFLCTSEALKHWPIRSTIHRWMMAACVSALSIMGLIRFVKRDDSTPQEMDSADQWMNSLLLPYAALAVAVVLILFCLLVHRCLHQKKKRCPEENQQRSVYLSQKKNQNESHRALRNKKVINQSSNNGE